MISYDPADWVYDDTVMQVANDEEGALVFYNTQWPVAAGVLCSPEYSPHL